MKKSLIKYGDAQTPLDRWSAYIAFIFDYNFDESLRYLKENDLDYKDLIDKDVQGYINSLKKDNYSVNSLNRKIVVFRNFYKYLVIEFDENIKNPMINY